MSTHPAGPALKDYAVRRYGDPALQHRLLDAQDRHNANVNVILYAGWLGEAFGITARDGDFEAALNQVNDWTGKVIRPLREVRRDLKQMEVRGGSGVSRLREAIKKAELDAEFHALELLEKVPLPSAPSRGSRASGEANIAAALVYFERHASTGTSGD